MTRALVTGGCGFIGRHLVAALVARGDEVVVLDQLSTGSDHAATLALGAEVVVGTVRHLDEVLPVMEDVDIVYHLAAETHVDRSLLDWATFLDTNVLGTAVVAEAATRVGVRVVAVSTDEVYGSVPAPHASLESDTLAPRSPYSASKAAADAVCGSWHASFGTDVVVTRCTNNYGPGQGAEKAIPTWIRALAAGEPAPIYGDGRHERDWLWVGDHVSALMLLAERGVSGEVYNIGAGSPVSNLSIARLLAGLADRAGGSRWWVSVPDRPGHDERYCVDSSKLAALGWAPQVSLADGLAETWFAR